MVTNDSLVCILQLCRNAVVAIFGPTDEKNTGRVSCIRVVKKIFLPALRQGAVRLKALACLNLVKVEDVMRAVREFFSFHLDPPPTSDLRELIMRTRRATCCTPVIKACALIPER